MSYQYPSRQRRGDEDSHRYVGGERHRGTHRKRRSRSPVSPPPPLTEKYPRLDHAGGGGASSFERMARSVLAGTLVTPSPPSQPRRDYAVFGKPIVRPSPPVSFGEMYQSSDGLCEINHVSDTSNEPLQPQPSINFNPTVSCSPTQPTSSRLKQSVIEDSDLTEMVSRAELELSVTDETPSRVLKLHRFVSQEELKKIYRTVFNQPLNHILPVIREDGPGSQTVLEFSSETKAAIFRRVLESHQIFSQFLPSSKSCQSINSTSLAVKEEFRAGIPRRTQLETYCICTVSLHCLASSSVEDGHVSAPVKISVYTGYDCVTRAVTPLQLTKAAPYLGDKIGLTWQESSLYLQDRFLMDTTVSDPSHFLTEMNTCFAKLLKQYNPENLYNKIILVFRTWQQAETFMNWIKLSDYQNQLMSLVHLVGVIPEYSAASTISLFNNRFSWKFPKSVNLPLQEECMALHSVIMSNLSQRLDGLKNSSFQVNIQDIVNYSVSIREALECSLPQDRQGFGNRVCFICLDYLHHNGDYQLLQIGASIIDNRNNKKKYDNSDIYTANVLPIIQADDSLLISELGFSRNNVTGKIEYHDLEQMTSSEVVSEIQALIGLFEFLSSRECLNSTLMSYSSSTTLPVLLNLLDRHGLDFTFYKTFSSFSDVWSLLEELSPGSDHFLNGTPPLSELASQLCKIKLSSQPSAGAGVGVSNLREFVIKLLDLNNMRGKEAVKLLKKCSQTIRAVKFSQASWCLPLQPLKKEFLWPNEQRLVEFKPDFQGLDLTDLSDLIIVLHSEVVTGSDKLLLLSKTITKKNISAVIKNLSSNHFLLDPDSSLGHLTLRPSPLNIPRILPSLQQEGGRQRKLSTLEGQFRNSTNIPPESIALALTENSGLYDGMSSMTEEIKQTRDGVFTITSNKTFHYSRESRKFDLLSVSLRCLQLKCSLKNLIPVQININSLWLRRRGETIYLVPWDPTSHPPEDFLCTVCEVTRGLHWPQSCPALERCSSCQSSERGHCRASCHDMDVCWNCEGPHFWKSCPHPILNRQQTELQKLGYVFSRKEGKLVVTFKEDEGDIQHQVVSRREAFLRIKRVVGVDGPGFEGSYLFSYNILNIFEMLVNMAEESGLSEEMNAFFPKIRGLIDVRWLFPESLSNKSLWSLCKILDPRSVRPTSELKYVDRALREILKTELNLSLFDDVLLICKKYSVKVKRSDFHTWLKRRIVPTKCLFRKVKDVYFELETGDPEEADEDDGIMNSYIKFKERPGTYYVSPVNLRARTDFILSIKSFEVGGKKYLHSLSLGSLKGNMLVDSDVIVPRDLYESVPETDSQMCRMCLIGIVPKPVLHRAEDCPCQQLCTIHPESSNPHKKVSCKEGSRCWNCGGSHNWRKCEHPLLTELQQNFSTVGYREAGFSEDSERSFTFSKDVGNVEMKVLCVREGLVMGRLLRILEKSYRDNKSNVIVGYNIAEQLTDLLECCESNRDLCEDLRNYIQGMMDVQWIDNKPKQSLKQIVARQCNSQSVNLTETRNVVKWISNILQQNQTTRVALKFTQNLAKALTNKNPGIEVDMNGSKSIKINTDHSKTLLAFFYLEHQNYRITTLEILIKSHKKRTALFFHKQDDSKPVNESDIKKALQDMMTALDKRESGSHLTVVTACPESLEVIKVNLERLSHSLVSVVDGWISLSAVMESNIPDSNLLLHCIEYQPEMIQKMYEFFINEKPVEKLLQTTKMMELLNHFCKTQGEEMITGRKIAVEDKNTIFLFFDIVFKDSQFNDLYKCPFINEILFKFENEPVKVAEKTDVFVELLAMRNLKRIVCVGLDDRSIAGLLQIAFWNTEVFDRRVVGLTTLKEVISVKRPSFKGNLEDILCDHGDLIDGKCKVKYLEAAFLQNVTSDLLRSVVQPLFSPYTNRVLLSSGLQIYSEHFVRMKLDTEVKTSGGNNTCQATVIESLWNLDDKKNNVKLEILPLKNLQGVITIPGQSSFIKKGEPVKVVIGNPSMSKTQPQIVPSGLVFGFIHLIPKPTKENSEFQSFKDAFRSRYPGYPPAALRELVESLRRSGMENYEESLQEILKKSKNVQNLQRNLHAFLVNDFLSPSVLMEILFQQLYDKFVSQQAQKEKYPNYQSILAKKFPENWSIKMELDGTVLEYKFIVERTELTRNAELIEIADDK